jgi:hypothetical protein
VRWKRSGTGKRGGLRVIYYVHHQATEFWMLTLYAKAKHDTVSTKVLRELKEAFENE